MNEARFFPGDLLVPLTFREPAWVHRPDDNPGSFIGYLGDRYCVVVKTGNLLALVLTGGSLVWINPDRFLLRAR